MKTPTLAAVFATFLVMALYVGSSRAQTTTLSLGTVSTPGADLTCPSGAHGTSFLSGTACASGTVSNCTGTVTIGYTIGVRNHSASGNSGTIVFFSGAEGTDVPGDDYVLEYNNAGYQTVQVLWSTAWQVAGTGTPPTEIKTSACRPASLLAYILDPHNGIFEGGGKCAQGTSAGSAAVAYSLAEYGAGGYLNNVELLSGPVLTDISVGCNPNTLPVKVCGSGSFCRTGGENGWNSPLTYSVPSPASSIDHWTGVDAVSPACMNPSRYATYTASWKDGSIVDTASDHDSTFSYPNTSVAGWLCSGGQPTATCGNTNTQNNSAGQGWGFYKSITGARSLALYRVDQCAMTEGVSQGVVPYFGCTTLGHDAIRDDMTSSCHP